MIDVEQAAARALGHAQLITIKKARATDCLLELDAACLRDGVLQPMRSSFYARQDRAELMHWCIQRGYYCLPTIELVDWLREEIGAESAIEIGAGHGAIGRALGIPITDAKVSDRADVREYYHRIGQGVVAYPPDVEKATANEAVERHRPAVVVGAWVTWKYEPAHHERGGNIFGVDELKLLKKRSVRRYVHVCHERIHARSPLATLPYREYKLPFLWARALDPLNVVRVWDR